MGETERKKVRLRRKKKRLRKWLVRVRQREKRMNRRWSEEEKKGLKGGMVWMKMKMEE